MGTLQDVYQWVEFLHLFGVIIFFLGHGASGSVSFRFRTERDPERVRAFLDPG
ncbi:MAG TPA: hypothetical protein VJ207_06090 [Thermoplasmata archaeon]|nr:hypothetical protein [Thermoplasmata archaeon]